MSIPAVETRPFCFLSVNQLMKIIYNRSKQEIRYHVGIPNNTIRDHVVPTGNPSISVRRVKQLCTTEMERK